MSQIRTIPYSGSVPTTNQLLLGDIAINTYDGKAYIKQASGSSQSIVQIGAGGGVTQIVAGTNVTLSPTTGVGVVTVNAIAGGGGSGSPNGPLYSLQYNNGGLFSGSSNFTLLNNNELYLTGSLKVSGSITGSLFGTSSWSSNSISSSFALSASYWSGSILNVTSASYALSSFYSGTSTTASYAQTASHAITAVTASYALNTVSSSFALTASYWSGSIINALSSSFATTASYWSGSILNATSASFASTASYVLNVISSSFASTSSYINTLNQNAIISGSLTVGNRTDTPSTENTLNVYPPFVGGTGEGGQILLAASGGLYSSASMLDNWQNQFRILRGSNTGGSNAGLVYVNLQTGDTQFVGSVTASAYSGLPNDYLYTTRNTNQTIGGGTWANQDVIFNNTVVSKGIGYSTVTGLAALTGGKVYRITARVAWASLGSYTFEISCYDNLNTQLGPIAQQLAPGNGSLNSSDGTLDFIYAPVSSTSIKIRTTGATSALSGEYIRGDLNTQLIIQQIA